ncbi:MAG: serine/threonine protein kinase [Deltaproteobacteria bacterium]|nr:serine/threonine protein kinase [Deltaproteobacteria bacterium]
MNELLPRGDGLCAACGAATSGEVCSSCGRDPRFGGRYRPLSLLGHGANGSTYRSRDEVTGAIVALKELPLGPAATLKTLELAEREATVLRQLHHPKIPRYLDHFISGQGKHSAHVLVQELIEGQDLSKELEARRFTEAEVMLVVEELLEVLAYLHSLSPPVIHRDIKPRNVIRRPDGGHALVDFGSVRDAMRDPDLGGSTIAGTFGFMAPEQLVGDAYPSSDLYGLGALAVNLLTRKAPATMGSDLRSAWVQYAYPGPLTKAFLQRLIDPDPTRRPQSAAEAKELLRTLRKNPQPSVPQNVVGALAVPPESSRSVQLSSPESNALDMLRGGRGSHRSSRVLDDVQMQALELGQVVGVIEEAFGRSGLPQVVGTSLRWRAADTRLIEVAVEPFGDGTRVRIHENFSQLAGGLYGGLVGGGAGGLGGGFAWLAGMLAGPAGVVGWLAFTTLGTVALARHFYGRTVENRTRQQGEAMDLIEAGLRALAARRGESQGPFPSRSVSE